MEIREIFNVVNGKVYTVVDTPYQLLNCISIVYYAKKELNLSVDLFIANTSNFPEKRIEKIKDTKLFDNVFVYEELDERIIRKNAIKYIILRINRFFFPKQYLYSLCHDKTCFERPGIDYLLCAYNIPFVMALSEVYSDAQIILFDEGVASYINNMVPITRKRKLLYALKRKNLPWLNIETILLNNSKYYTNGFAKKAEQIPKLRTAPQELRDMLFDIFDYAGSDFYSQARFVYLMQPLNEDSDKEDLALQSSILQLLEQKIPTCVARKHPKQTLEFKTSLTEDACEDMWELICSQTINDDHIIIGSFSTAQLTPKLIFDLEPTLIFTYKLYKNLLTDDQINHIEDTIRTLKKSYTDADKIVIPYTIEDLEEKISNLSQGCFITEPPC